MLRLLRQTSSISTARNRSSWRSSSSSTSGCMGRKRPLWPAAGSAAAAPLSTNGCFSTLVEYDFHGTPTDQQLQELRQHIRHIQNQPGGSADVVAGAGQQLLLQENLQQALMWSSNQDSATALQTSLELLELLSKYASSEIMMDCVTSVAYQWHSVHKLRTQQQKNTDAASIFDPQRFLARIDDYSGNKASVKGQVLSLVLNIAYARKDCVQFCLDLWQRLLQKEGFLPSTENLNMVLHSLTKWQQQPRRHDTVANIADTILAEAQEAGVAPDLITYNTLLNVYAQNDAVDAAEALLRQMLLPPGLDDDETTMTPPAFQRTAFNATTSLKPSLTTFNTMLQCYAQSKSAVDAPERAEALLRAMRHGQLADGTLLPSSVRPNLTSYHTVISCWARHGSQRRPTVAARQALALLDDIKRAADAGELPEGGPTRQTYAVVLHALAKAGQPARAEAVLSSLMHRYLRTGDVTLQPNLQLLTLVLQCWCTHGRLERAEDVWQRLHELYAQGYLQEAPDATCYHVMLQGYVLAQSAAAAHKAEVLLQQMQTGSVPAAGNHDNNNNTETEQRARYRPPRATFQTYTLVIRAHLAANTETSVLRATALLHEAVTMTTTRTLPSGQDGKHQHVDMRTVEGVLSGLCRHGHVSQAEAVLSSTCEHIAAGHIRPLNARPFGIVVSALSSLDGYAKMGQRADRVVRALETVRGAGYPDAVADGLLYRVHIKCWFRSREKNAGKRAWHLLREARQLVQEGKMQVCSGLFDTRACNQVLFSLALNFAPSQANRLLELMRHDSLTDSGQLLGAPDAQSYNNVLMAWARMDRVPSAVGHAEALLQRMRQQQQHDGSSLMPNAGTYYHVLTCWFKARQFGKERRLARMEALWAEMNDKMKVQTPLHDQPDNTGITQDWYAKCRMLIENVRAEGDSATAKAKADMVAGEALAS